MKRTVITLDQAQDYGIINLSDNQIKKAKRNGVVNVSYSIRAGEQRPLLLDELGEAVYKYDNNKLHTY